MTNPNDELNTLWEMSGEGAEEWWPDCLIRFTNESDYGWTYYGSDAVEPQHALDLVHASVERWLVGKRPWPFDACWERDLERGSYSLAVHDYPECTSILFEGSLPEVIKYAMGQENTHNN